MKILVTLLLFAAGLLLRPVENSIHAERKALKYGGSDVSLEMRDRLGQGMAIGLLAGFRGVVADFLWIQSHGFWEKKEWIRQYRNIELVTTLQPQSVMFWDLGQWHMAWNIAYAALTDPENRTKAEGIKRQREWQERARDFLDRGLENIPNRYDLYFMMGYLYQEKFKDYCQAAKYYDLAARFKDAPSYVPRMYARALEKCGDVQGAYEYWKHLWSLDHSKTEQIWNVIEREIKRLEDELKIPNEQRVFPKPADTSADGK